MPDAQKLSFEDWITKLNRLENIYGSGPVTDHTGVACWKDYWEDGYSPEDALSEDADHA